MTFDTLRFTGPAAIRTAGEPPGEGAAADWWQSGAEQLLHALDARAGGLGSDEAAARLRTHGPNALARASRLTRAWRGARRLSNPLVLVLIVAGTVALLTGQAASAGIIATVVVLSLVVDQWQQQRAEQAAARLAAQVALTAAVLRDGAERNVPVAELVPGDVVRLAAGSLVPADGILLQAEDLFVQQSALTGEAFPVERRAGRPAPPLADGIEAALFMGSSVVSGTAMASMAAAALVLPFLPMLPVQVLLANLLYDGVSATLPLDHVEPADLARPQHWDMALLRRFMLVIGPVSSLFDLLTFGLLLWLLHASAPQFQSGWPVESMATQVLAMFVIRTPGPALAGRPHPMLVAAALVVLLVAALLPATPVGASFGLVPLPPVYYAALAAMTVTYLCALEWAKRAFWRHARRRGPHRR